MAIYRIESRYPQWAKWRTVTPSPHRERNPFDKIGLRFDNLEDATRAMTNMQRANAGEFRISETESSLACE